MMDYADRHNLSLSVHPSLSARREAVIPAKGMAVSLLEKGCEPRVKRAYGGRRVRWSEVMRRSLLRVWASGREEGDIPLSPPI